MLRRSSLLLLTLSLGFLSIPGTLTAAEPVPPGRPNILWLIVEDMSDHFGCYGEKSIATPHVDRLAREGVRFDQAFVTAPVCSTARSALITGMYQTAIGAHQHRSGRGTVQIHLPKPVIPVPVLFRQAGYFTVNGGISNKGNRISKTDYNFTWDEDLYDGNDWSKRKPGQPFFAQIQLRGGKLRHGGKWDETVKRDLGSLTNPDQVTLPPYYPNDPVLLEDWAQYLDTVRYTDWEVGRILARLEAEGDLANTVIFFLTDHGISHARGKQFCYEDGMKIPLIVRGPKIPADRVREDLVEHIDLAATSLALAGIGVPNWMQARDLLSKAYTPREAAFCARDRCDETVDRIRAVRTQRYKYIRNFLPRRPYLQPNAYKDHKEILIRLRELHAAGRLDEFQDRIFAAERPAEELYDLEQDPWERHNLAGSPDHQSALETHRQLLLNWMLTTNDRGRWAEPADQYDSDMKVYLDTLKVRRPDRLAEIESNIKKMKKWAAEGK